MNRLGSAVAPLANLTLRSPLGRLGKQALGVHPKREIAPFATETFERWFKQHQAEIGPQPERPVAVYFHDTFTNYTYPQIGRATVRLLEAAGYRVEIVARRACCGRPMLSKGLVEGARKLARQNVAALAPYVRKGIPVIGTEPSCILTLRDEYVDLLPNDADATAVAAHAFLLDEFLAKLDAEGDLGIAWKHTRGPEVLFHGHCHQKALAGTAATLALLRGTGAEVVELDAGCCGMAGSFGFEAEHYALSMRIGEDRLFPAVRAEPADTLIAATGVSCRQQIEHGTGRRARHPVQLVYDATSWRAPGAG
jgi:Fe-S oxidoreductase